MPALRQERELGTHKLRKIGDDDGPEGEEIELLHDRKMNAAGKICPLHYDDSLAAIARDCWPENQ